MSRNRETATGGRAGEYRVSAGDRRRDAVRRRQASLSLAGLGAVLLGAGVVAGGERLFFAWGGTALFLAALLAYVLTGPTVPAAVTSDVYTALAATARRRTRPGLHWYAPDDGGVSLVVDGAAFDPVGARLLSGATVPDVSSVPDRLAVLVDVLVHDLELAERASGTVAGQSATVTVTGCRVATAERFDHPVGSLVAVGLAAHLEVPVRLEADGEDDALVVTCRWSQRPDELLERADADEGGEDEAPDG